MNKDLVQKLVDLTGDEVDVVSERLDGLTIDQLYNIIDAFNKGDTEAALSTYSFNELEEDMSKGKQTGRMPKPRDPMAKALALPQYKAQSTPSKKGMIDKLDRKHKGNKGDDSFGSSPFESAVMESGSLFSQIPSITRLLALAGRPEGDSESKMEDVFATQRDSAMDFSKYGIHKVPVGTKLVPGLVNVSTDAVIELPEFPELDDTAIYTEAYKGIRDAVEQIKVRLPDVKVTEMAAIKKLISQLSSDFDQLLNGISK